MRRRHADLFARGDYRPLDVRGTHAEHVCAFARTGPGGPTVTIVPRLLAPRANAEPVGGEYWGDTAIALPAEVHVSLRDAFTGVTVEAEGPADDRRLDVGTVLSAFPIALLEAA